MANDPVDAVIAAYMSYLENGGPEPALDHLNNEQRREALELISLIEDARGVDFYRSPPPLDAVLAGSELEDRIEPPVTVGLSVDAIRVDVVSSLGSAAEPIVDAAAHAEGIQSDAVVRFGALRVRVQFRDDVPTVADLGHIDPRAAAGPIFGRFPETATVVVVIGDDDRSSVAIDPYDTEEFIGTPDGETYPPRITRPILPLYDTLRRLVDELAPDLTVDDVDDHHEPADLADIVETACASAQAAVVTEGKKARIDAKKETWPNFDEHPLLVSLCQSAAADHLTEVELDERITAAAAAA
ncbi:MAG: hypothetical protein ACR2H3_07525 [Acidimicrobiales bacterium]